MQISSCLALIPRRLDGVRDEQLLHCAAVHSSASPAYEVGKLTIMGSSATMAGPRRRRILVASPIPIIGWPSISSAVIDISDVGDLHDVGNVRDVGIVDDGSRLGSEAPR